MRYLLRGSNGEGDRGGGRTDVVVLVLVDHRESVPNGKGCRTTTPFLNLGRENMTI